MAPGKDLVRAASTPQWTWQLPARKPAWEFNGDMPRDLSYSPVGQGNLVLIGSFTVSAR